MRRRILAWGFSWLLSVAMGPAAGEVLTPASQAAIESLREGARRSDSDALRVVRDSVVLAEERKNEGPEQGFETMSVTKSLVALGIGHLLTEGKITSLDQPVADFFPEWKQGRKALITLRMLLDHTSGLQNVADTSVEIYPAPDGWQLALAAEISNPPGQQFAYNNKAMNLLAAVFEKAAGERMDRYIQRTLLTPMGIEGRTWNDHGFDRAGHPYAMAGWNATADAMVKVGQLVLDEGRWQGRVLVDAGFIREMVAQSPPDVPEYGLLWWRRTESVFLSIDPEAVEVQSAAGMHPDIVDALRGLAGRRFHTEPDLRSALDAETPGGRQALIEAVKSTDGTVDDLVNIQHGPVVAWEASGYRGQYIVVVPRARLIAVRQIGDRDVDQEADWPYGYEDFTSRVIALARTFESDLAIRSRALNESD